MKQKISLKFVIQNLKKKTEFFGQWNLKIKLIGTIVFHRISIDDNYAEIGYELNTNYQKKGFMSEAMEKCFRIRD